MISDEEARKAGVFSIYILVLSVGVSILFLLKISTMFTSVGIVGGILLWIPSYILSRFLVCWVYYSEIQESIIIIDSYLKERGLK